ncbi:hypothetical protein [Chroococcus sp. FPU101]|uniref:hypothetical protein n=1 Tax=Chroococcus sp. FPU101 TaxID=1974212 RepID=UPI001A8FC5F4|nr:hypothetical protein [Chroococcus sp. FPU101]
MCVEANINSTAIRRWTGTSAKMIDKHYGATNFTNLRPLPIPLQLSFLTLVPVEETVHYR